MGGKVDSGDGHERGPRVRFLTSSYFLKLVLYSMGRLTCFLLVGYTDLPVKRLLTESCHKLAGPFINAKIFPAGKNLYLQLVFIQL